MNRLYYGDNLDVLRRHIENESVDLVYLDPPFNSNASYNVLFAERDGTQAASQIKAFEDTWKWDESAARAYEEVVEAGGRVSQAMQAFRTLLGESDMMAYLALDREHAEIGILLCMEEPTGPMRKEATSAGFYKSPWGKHPRLQILTIEDLLTGKTLDRPPAQTSVTFKRAPKAEAPPMKGRPLDFEAVEDEPTDAEQD